MKFSFFYSLLMSLGLLCSCSNDDVNYYLIVGDSASAIELNTVNDLKNYLIKVISNTSV